MLKPKPKTRWRRGPPNKPGLWLVITSTGDLVVWDCCTDRDDCDGGTMGKPYMRFFDGMDSAPVDWEHKQFPVRKSYGPVRRPKKEPGHAE